MNWAFTGLGALLLGWAVTLVGCRTSQPPRLGAGSVTVQTSRLAGQEVRWPRLAFDAAGTLLCVTWRTQPQGGPEGLGYAIVDSRGVVRSSSTTGGDTNVVSRFPRLAVQLAHPMLLRQARQTNCLLGEREWAVAPDTSWLAVLRCTNSSIVSVELWRLKPGLEKAWSWSHPHPLSPAAELIGFRWRERDLLAVDAGDKAVLLDVLSGGEVDAVPYAAPGERCYTRSCMQAIPELGVMALTSRESKRVRLRSLEAPHSVAREVGSKGVNWMGVPWLTHELKSAANGRWLLRDCSWSGRYAGYQHEIGIIELETGREVWRWTDAEQVALSPGGTRAAICRAGVIELQLLSQARQ